MDTPPQHRFENLFEGQNKPLAPDPPAVDTTKSSNSAPPSKDTDPWADSEEWQAPVRLNNDQLASSDEDEYIAAFKKEPQMNLTKSKPKRRPVPSSDALGYSEGLQREPLIPLKYLPKGKDELTGEDPAHGEDLSEDDDLPSIDRYGNPSMGHFCVFQLVSKFPYKYMNDGNDRVSRHFFANNKFYDRKWDVYYIHPPESSYSKAILLLPYNKVRDLIQDIGKTFKIAVAVPPAPFTMSFFDDGTPQPILLGTSTSRDEFFELQQSIPSVPIGHGEAPENASKALKFSFEAFKAKCEQAQAANKKKQAAIKRKKLNDRLLQAQDWVKQLRRAQRYLGLRVKSSKPEEPDANLSWAAQESFRKAQEKKCNVVLQPLDINAPPPSPFEKDCIFISVDVESYERAHHLITEVGVSTLDTRDLLAISPGIGGKNWMKHIRSRHFRIKEHLHLINREFCAGNPDKFQFGTSEFVSLTEAPIVVDSCFEAPFCASFKHNGILWEFIDWSGIADDDSGRSVNIHGPSNAHHHQANQVVAEKLLGPEAAASYQIDGHASPPPVARELSESKHRNIILLGHDLPGDLEYLRLLGSRIFAPQRTSYPVPATELRNPEETKYATILHHILEGLDTAILYRVLTRENQNRKLTTILSELGRCAWFAHNAGNDARYTMEAFIAMTVKARLLEDQAEAERQARLAACGSIAIADQNGAAHADSARINDAWQTEKARRIAVKVEAARREASEECEVWERAGAPGTKTTLRSSTQRDQAEASAAQADGECIPGTTSTGVNSRGVFATSLPLSPKSLRAAKSQSPTAHQNIRTENLKDVDADDHDGGVPGSSFADQLTSTTQAAADRNGRTAKKWAAQRRREMVEEVSQDMKAEKEAERTERPPREAQEPMDKDLGGIVIGERGAGAEGEMVLNSDDEDWRPY